MKGSCMDLLGTLHMPPQLENTWDSVVQQQTFRLQQDQSG